MTRIQIYNAIDLLDHFADHESILGLTSDEVELLGELRSDLIWRLRDEGNRNRDDLQGLWGESYIVKRQAPGVCDD